MRRILGATLAIVAMAAAGCGGDDEGGGSEGGNSATNLRGQSITVWNTEFQPDRMCAACGARAQAGPSSCVLRRLVLRLFG